MSKIRRTRAIDAAEVARGQIAFALEMLGADLTPESRELLEAVKHIDNARKMLREEKTQ